MTRTLYEQISSIDRKNDDVLRYQMAFDKFEEMVERGTAKKRVTRNIGKCDSFINKECCYFAHCE